MPFTSLQELSPFILLGMGIDVMVSVPFYIVPIIDPCLLMPVCNSMAFVHRALVSVCALSR